MEECSRGFPVVGPRTHSRDRGLWTPLESQSTRNSASCSQAPLHSFFFNFRTIRTKAGVEAAGDEARYELENGSSVQW